MIIFTIFKISFKIIYFKKKFFSIKNTFTVGFNLVKKSLMLSINKDINFIFIFIFY